MLDATEEPLLRRRRLH